MPALIPAIIPLIAGAAGVGGLVSSVGSLLGGGGPSSADQAKQAQAAELKQAQADAETKRKMLLAALPGAQEQAGGALNAPSLTDLAAVIAGLPGEANTGVGKGALSSFLGTGTGATGATGAPPQDTMVGATYGLSGSQG